MELFLPGLVVLLLAAFFVFLVLPRFGSTILVVVSLVALLLAGIHHYYMFSSEYRLSTWQVGLASYAPWLIIILALLFVIASLQYIFRPRNTGFFGTPAPTPAETIANSISSSFNAMTGANRPTNSFTGAINSVLTGKPNNSPLIPGLGFSGSQV
jgi:hypothetical protein